MALVTPPCIMGNKKTISLLGALMSQLRLPFCEGHGSSINVLVFCSDASGHIGLATALGRSTKKLVFEERVRAQDDWAGLYLVYCHIRCVIHTAQSAYRESLKDSGYVTKVVLDNCWIGTDSIRNSGASTIRRYLADFVHSQFQYGDCDQQRLALRRHVYEILDFDENVIQIIDAPCVAV